MTKKCSILLPAAVVCFTCALPSQASLVGSQVNGSLSFAGDPSNYFDPGYGFVPGTGYLNASGPTVTISDAAVEFGYDDGASLISADFSDNQLTISDVSELSGPTNGFELVFADPAFAGQSLTLLSDDFPLVDYTLLGNFITVDYAGGNLTAGETFDATFATAATPEPSTLSLLSVALFACFSASVTRKLRPVTAPCK